MKKVIGLLILLVAIFSGVTAQSGDMPQFIGTIAYIGADYNVYTALAEEDRVSIAQLTEDADSNRHYQYPTWSTDGRLAYFCCDPLYIRGSLAEVYITSARSG